MDVVGIYDIDLHTTPTTRHPSPRPSLVAEVELKDDGSKVITLRSRVSVHNKAGIPLHVMVAVPRLLGRPAHTSAFFSEESILPPDDVKYVVVVVVVILF